MVDTGKDGIPTRMGRNGGEQYRVAPGGWVDMGEWTPPPQGMETNFLPQKETENKVIRWGEAEMVDPDTYPTFAFESQHLAGF